MQKNKMDISILNCDYKERDMWYQDESINLLLTMMVNTLGSLQCSFQNHILVCSKEGRAVFDSDGRMIELYDLQKNPNLNIIDSSDNRELEFQMILLFSKINK